VLAGHSIAVLDAVATCAADGRPLKSWQQNWPGTEGQAGIAPLTHALRKRALNQATSSSKSSACTTTAFTMAFMIASMSPANRSS
jgi:hypothetical protein